MPKNTLLEQKLVIWLAIVGAFFGTMSGIANSAANIVFSHLRLEVVAGVLAAIVIIFGWGALRINKQIVAFEPKLK